jgi:7-keto-8-aminopelargonate synthetase-like enzyme
LIPPPLLQSPPGPTAVIDGREYLYFAGTGYLGLHRDKRVIAAATGALKHYGMGTGTSRTGFGTTEPLLDVERAAAKFLDARTAVYLPSGYMGAAAIIRAMADAFDAVFIDEASHYSVFDAGNGSGRPVYRFRHGDADHLAEKLAANVRRSERPLVMTDGVFALLGDIAPLDEYVKVLTRYPGAALYVDDAHGLGVLGDTGRGTFEHHQLAPVNVLNPGGVALWHSATLSKAIGGYGGVVAGASEFIEQVAGRSPLFAGTSPVPPMLAAGTARALAIAAAEPQRRTHLRRNITQLKQGLKKLGVTVSDAPTPIVCIATGDDRQMQRVQKQLMNQGVAIAYFATYSGSTAGGALRIAVFADHTEAQIQHLLLELERAL